MRQHEVTSTVRVTRADGSSVETMTSDEGRVEVVERAADGAEIQRRITAFTPEGSLVRSEQAPGQPAIPCMPATEDKRINSYGSTVEHLVYADEVAVETSFDDDGNLRSTEVTGPWGLMTMRVRADGSRTLVWETPFHEGTRTWAAGGVEASYEVEFADGSSHRREQIDDIVRVSTVGRDGRTEVTEQPVPSA